MNSETRWFAGCNGELTIDDFAERGHDSKELTDTCCSGCCTRYNECTRAHFKATIEYTIKREVVAN